MFKLHHSQFPYRDLLPLVVPLLFFFFGLTCLLKLDLALVIDAYFYLASTNFLLDTGVYTGFAAISWPPLYGMLMTFLGLFFSLEVSGKLVSLLSGTVLLATIPYFVRSLNYNQFPGIFIQVLLASSPFYFKYSLNIDNHVLDACLFLLASFCVIRFFKNKNRGLISFLFFSLLAVLTKYGSVVLIVGFILILLQSTARIKKRKRKIYFIIIVSIAVLTPWFIYNYSVNDIFVKGIKVELLVGQGLVRHDLIEAVGYEWWAYNAYRYAGVLDLIVTHPFKYFLSVVKNLWKLLKFVIDSSPLFGSLSFLSTIGLVKAFNLRKKSEYAFLLTTTILYVIPVSLMLVVPLYFLHLNVIWASIGLAEVCQWFGQESTKTQKKTILFYAFLSFLFTLSIFQMYSHLLSTKELIRTQFYQDLESTRNVKNGLGREKKRAGKRKVKIMTMFPFFPVIFQSGFEPVQAPPPEGSPLKYLCYNTLSSKQRYYYRKLNYPPNQDLSSYVPPDYLLMTESLKRSIEQSSSLSLNSLEPYLQKLPDWPSARVILYKINLKKNKCPSPRKTS